MKFPAYGTVRTLARLINEREVATLLSHTLGEEESADFLLTTLSKPLIQQASLEDHGAAHGQPKVKKPTPRSNVHRRYCISLLGRQRSCVKSSRWRGQ